MALRNLVLPLCLACISSFAIGIEEVERRALKQSLTILSASETAAAEKEFRKEILSSWLPQAFFTWNIKKYQTPSTTSGSEKGSYSGSFDIYQTIFDLSLLRSYQKASFDLKLSDLEVADVSVDTLFAVRSMYYSVILEREIEGVRKRKVDLLRQSLAETQRRFELGSATLFDVRQATVFMKNAEPAVRAAKRSSLSAQDKLAELLGMPPSNRDFTVDKEAIPVEKVDWLKKILAEKTVPRSEFSKWEQLAQAASPRLLIARVQIDKGHAEVRESQARYAPRIDGFFNVSSPETAKFNQQSWSWSTGLAIRVPLFEGFGRRRAVRGSKARLRSVRLEAKSAELAQMVEVRNQLYRVNEQVENFFSTQEAFELAQLSRIQAAEKYRLGMITLLDYKTSIDDLFEAEVKYHTARFDLLSAYFALLRASGADLIKCIEGKLNGK